MKNLGMFVLALSVSASAIAQISYSIHNNSSVTKIELSILKARELVITLQPMNQSQRGICILVYPNLIQASLKHDLAFVEVELSCKDELSLKDFESRLQETVRSLDADASFRIRKTN